MIVVSDAADKWSRVGNATGSCFNPACLSERLHRILTAATGLFRINVLHILKYNKVSSYNFSLPFSLYYIAIIFLSANFII